MKIVTTNVKNVFCSCRYIPRWMNKWKRIQGFWSLWRINICMHEREHLFWGCRCWEDSVAELPCWDWKQLGAGSTFNSGVTSPSGCSFSGLLFFSVCWWHVNGWGRVHQWSTDASLRVTSLDPNAFFSEANTKAYHCMSFPTAAPHLYLLHSSIHTHRFPHEWNPFLVFSVRLHSAPHLHFFRFYLPAFSNSSTISYPTDMSLAVAESLLPFPF